MPKRFNSAFTMFVHLKGRQLLEYYFDLADTREAANEPEWLKRRGARAPTDPGR